MLEDYIKSPEGKPPSRGSRLALAKLLKFLSDKGSSEKALYQGRKDTSGAEWTTIVAHYLLSKLAVCSKYTLDSHSFSKGRIKELCCGCGCKERLSGDYIIYGDTSIGVPSYWHGRVDIRMDVAVTVATEDPDSQGAENSSFSVDVESPSERMMMCKEQIRARTIVFSFLQQKNQPDLNNFLIPTIAMSKSKVAVYLYDSENDIFLETPCLDLFLGDEFLKVETIITLWLVLNFKYCCSGVPDEILELGFTADFFKHTGPHLEKYIANVNAPCNYQPEDKWLALSVLKDVKHKVQGINNI
ncbi:uncharacterized protein LOC132718247 [Ruditapes philippinarum]|uniref:uncharacterized protein LOC132718247 n=1 Tax=Ruditapes philippinarum TaxID=129788 RepID=UPI00295A9573|nr:uncharacterized protein LOC132718247 [Ruditapes philippinarum]